LKRSAPEPAGGVGARNASSPRERNVARGPRIVLASLAAAGLAMLAFVRALSSEPPDASVEAAAPIGDIAPARPEVESALELFPRSEMADATPRLRALTGRVLDENGEPVAGRAIGISVIASAGKEWTWTARRECATGDDGHFALAMDYGESTTGVGVEVRLGEWATAELAARGETRVALGAQSCDLGDLALTRLPPLISGVVRSRVGVPLFHAVVSARDASERGAAELLSTTDTLGRFDLRGFVGGPRVTVTARRTGFFESDRLEAEVGDHAVEVALDAVGWMHGQVLADASVPFEALDIVAVPTPARDRFSARTQYDGSFEIRDLPTARYKLRLLERSSRDVLFEDFDIPVENGIDVSGDPFHVIDVRGQFRGVQLALRDALTGELIEDAAVYSDEGDRCVLHRTSKGLVTILTTQPHIAVAVRARGYSLLSADDVQNGDALRLWRAPRITLELPRTVELPPNGEALRCELRLASAGDLHRAGALDRARDSRTTFDAYFTTRRTAQVAVEVEGTYVVSFTVRRPRGDRPAVRLDGPGDGQRVQVGGFGSAASFTVAPPQASYDAWLASLR
jgi:hypothetical protein